MDSWATFDVSEIVAAVIAAVIGAAIGAVVTIYVEKVRAKSVAASEKHELEELKTILSKPPQYTYTPPGKRVPANPTEKDLQKTIDQLGAQTVIGKLAMTENGRVSIENDGIGGDPLTQITTTGRTLDRALGLGVGQKIQAFTDGLIGGLYGAIKGD